MANLFYQLTGAGDCLTFIHGDTLDHRLWEDQVKFFSRHCKVLTYDMQGYGRSPNPTQSFAHHVDLKILLDSLNISSTHLVGLSLGGEIAIDFTLEYPQLVKSLTLANSALGGFDSTVDWGVNIQAGLETAKANWLTHPLFSSIQNKPEIFLKLTEILKDYQGSNWLTNFRKKLTPPAKDRLHEIQCPTQIILGENDLSYFHDIANLIHQSIPQSFFHCLLNTGHLANLEQPDQFNVLLYNFITAKL